MHSSVFYEHLERAKAGEDPEWLFMEFYAHCDRDEVESDDG